MAHFEEVLLKKASREDALVSFPVVDHSKDRSFYPEPQFSQEGRTKKGLECLAEGGTSPEQSNQKPSS